MRLCTCRRFVFFDVRVSIFCSPWSLVVGRWQKPTITTLKYSREIKHPSPFGVGQRPRANDGLLRPCLTNLLLQPLAGVAYALVLVRIGRTQAAHFGGDLSNFLAVDAG